MSAKKEIVPSHSCQVNTCCFWLARFKRDLVSDAQQLKDESSLLSLEAGKLGVPTLDLTPPSGQLFVYLHSAAPCSEPGRSWDRWPSHLSRTMWQEKRELSDLVKCFVCSETLSTLFLNAPNSYHSSRVNIPERWIKEISWKELYPDLHIRTAVRYLHSHCQPATVSRYCRPLMKCLYTLCFRQIPKREQPLITSTQC